MPWHSDLYLLGEGLLSSWINWSLNVSTHSLLSSYRQNMDDTHIYIDFRFCLIILSFYCMQNSHNSNISKMYVSSTIDIFADERMIYYTRMQMPIIIAGKTEIERLSQSLAGLSRETKRTSPRLIQLPILENNSFLIMPIRRRRPQWRIKMKYAQSRKQNFMFMRARAVVDWMGSHDRPCWKQNSISAGKQAKHNSICSHA